MYAAIKGTPNRKTDFKNFAEFYSIHEGLIGKHVWQQYYSRPFLLQAATACYWRLPDLRDLPDLYWYRDHLSDPEAQASGPLTKLLYWANNVVATYWRQPLLSTDRMLEIALATLEETIDRQRTHPRNLEPYSLTQEKHWLNRLGLHRDREQYGNEQVSALYSISENIADDEVDVLEWKYDYTPETWHSEEARTAFVRSDLGKHEATRYRGPGARGWDNPQPHSLDFARGWTSEIGSEEEVLFLATVAYGELADLSNFDDLDFLHRSHILMGILCAALERASDDREIALANVKRRIIAAGRLDDEEAAELWVSQVMTIMQPYLRAFRSA